MLYVKIRKSDYMSNYLIDMHCHTTASDGSLTPTEIVKLAKESDLKAIAILLEWCIKQWEVLKA